MAGKEVAVKKYVVRLSEEERARLEAFVRKGKRAAPLLTRARILLKADVSEAGDGWSDSRIAEALDTSIPTVERARRQLVVEGFDAVLTRKSNPKSAPRRIFDGAAEAKLIALACGSAPAGHARWTLRLLEEKVVELQIVGSASDNTIAVDYAHALKDLSDMHFPGADKIVLVQDNLSTHTAASLYEAFPAAEARRLVERFEWHYTPKHGSWLDMAESELAVLSTQCLDRRISDKADLVAEVAAWQKRRNTLHAKADWQFTTADARVKLARLYPQFV